MGQRKKPGVQYAADKNRLWNIFQKYLYEMSAYYDMEMDFSGNYEYRYFDTYFEENGRAA